MYLIHFSVIFYSLSSGNVASFEAFNSTLFSVNYKKFNDMKIVPHSFLYSAVFVPAILRVSRQSIREDAASLEALCADYGFCLTICEPIKIYSYISKQKFMNYVFWQNSKSISISGYLQRSKRDQF